MNGQWLSPRTGRRASLLGPFFSSVRLSVSVAVVVKSAGRRQAIRSPLSLAPHSGAAVRPDVTGL